MSQLIDENIFSFSLGNKSDSEFGPFTDFSSDDTLLKDDDDDFDFSGKIMEAAAKNKEVQQQQQPGGIFLFFFCHIMSCVLIFLCMWPISYY